MIIYKSDRLTVTLMVSAGSALETPSGEDNRSWNITHQQGEAFKLVLRGQGRIVWPNREGEGFSLQTAQGRLKELGAHTTGVAVSWPATASLQGIVFIDGDQGYLFHSPRDNQGRHREIRIHSTKNGLVEVSFSGTSSRWSLEKQPLPRSLSDEDISYTHRSHRYQFQLGLINPWGATAVPSEEGFDIISQLASRLLKSFGPFDKKPLMHLFGYGAGHDRFYPDYTPSARLGGPSSFSKALTQVKEMGFIPSCYLNARIVDEAGLKKFAPLKPGITLDDQEEPLVEVYQGRRFFVMDPNFEPWLDELFHQAEKLKSLGAQAVQLDQVAGRAPTVKPGEIWGQGYRRLIQRIQETGLKVWIQGVCPYYHADWFEMTHRDLKILNGGTLRGGLPLGETDLSLLRSVTSGGTYLIPGVKLKTIPPEDLSEMEIIKDVLGDGGVLPIYGTDYLAEIESLENNGLI